MKSKKVIVGSVVVLLLLSGCAIYASGSSTPKAPPQGLVVGVFDSRAVCVAYTWSKKHDLEVREKMAERKAAEIAGDQEKLNELKQWGEKDQDRRHKQGFGTASVKNLLEYVKGDIPKVAKEAGVDIIVSKWDLAYQSPNARFVDVTELIIRGFEPSEKALKTIRVLKKHKPLSDKVIEEHKH
jgi:hypothetical protein